MPMPVLSEKGAGYSLIFLAGVLWGTIGTFVNTLNSYGADSALTGFLRLFFGCLLMIPVVWKLGGGRKAFLMDRRTLGLCALMGLLSQGLFNLCYAEAIRTAGVATGAVLLYTAPVFVCILSRLLFHEAIGPRKCIALLINVAGCVLTVTGGNFTAVKFSVYGVAMGVCAGFLYGLITIFGKKTAGRAHPAAIVFYSFLFGSLVLAAAARPWNRMEIILQGRFILVAVGFALIPTVVAYLIYMIGLEKDLEASKVPVVASIETVVSAMFGVVLFSEPMGAAKAAGVLCVMASIAVMNRTGRNGKTMV